MQKNEISYSLPAISEKKLVRKALIAVKSAKVEVMQHDLPLFAHETTDLSLSESFAQISNILFYRMKSSQVRPDKINAVTVRLSIGGQVAGNVVLPVTYDKTGKANPFTSSKIAQGIKKLYWSLAADVLEEATMNGQYFNFVHAANSIARFTPAIIVSGAPKAAIVKAVKAQASK